jgi:6-hydroxycyclohex-1-ene-1-carbonyl-CoA dehydrogenase
LPFGHEISGTIVKAGASAQEWLERFVVVPAQPNDDCDVCGHQRAADPNREASQLLAYSGFASHIVTSTRGLCVVDETDLRNSPVELADLAVVAEAVGTPYQAITCSNLREQDVAIFIGVTGTAVFGIQIASLLGSHVIGLDTDDDNLQRALELGAAFVVNIEKQAPSAVRALLVEHIKKQGRCSCGWKIYETLGTREGERLALELITSTGVLSFVGNSDHGQSIRLGDLQPSVATTQKACCCNAEVLPAVLDLVLAHDIEVSSCVDRRPMSSINETFDEIRAKRTQKRHILIPDFE